MDKEGQRSWQYVTITSPKSGILLFNGIVEWSFEVVGIIGVPHLSVLQHFDCSMGVIIDDLHAIYEGVVPKILTIWFKELSQDQVRFAV